MSNDRNERPDTPAAGRGGGSLLVPVGMGAVFAILAILWVSMSGHDEKSTAKDVLTRPGTPENQNKPGG